MYDVPLAMPTPKRYRVAVPACVDEERVFTNRSTTVRKLRQRRQSVNHGLANAGCRRGVLSGNEAPVDDDTFLAGTTVDSVVTNLTIESKPPLLRCRAPAIVIPAAVPHRGGWITIVTSTAPQAAATCTQR